jgi:tetratricopeptide (TPR) repeat protein
MKEEQNNNEFEGNRDDLISRYEEMIQDGKHYYFDVEDLEFILDFYIDMNQMGKAKSAVRYAFDLHPEALPLQIKKAKILLKNNNPKRALSTLEDIEVIENANTELYQIKGHAYVLLKDIQSAKQQYNQAIEFIQDKEELIDTLYSISQTLQFQEQYKLAIQYLQQAYDQANDYLFILYDLAYCYERIENTKESLFYYEKYLEKDPFSDHVWFTVGRLYEDLGNTDKALEAYNFVHAINPKFLDVLLEIARIYEDNFQYEKAIKNYKEYSEAEPESYEVNYYLGNCYNLLDDLNEAIRYYQKSLDIEPFNSEVFHGLASVYYKMNNLKDAKFYSKRAILVNEDNPKFHVLYGKVSSRLNNKEDAVKAFRKAVDLKPQLVYYWILLVDELIRQDDFSRSIRILKESTEFHDNSSAILFRLSAVQFKKGNTNLSLQTFKKAMTLDRKNYHEFFNICPEAKASKAINKILTDQTIKK